MDSASFFFDNFNPYATANFNKNVFKNSFLCEFITTNL